MKGSFIDFLYKNFIRIGRPRFTKVKRDLEVYKIVHDYDFDDYLDVTKCRCKHYLCTLIIPKGETIYATSIKCRSKLAKVQSIQELIIRNKNVITTNNYTNKANSWYSPEFEYKVGETVTVPEKEFKVSEMCTTGIHFFLSKQEAKDWLLFIEG